MRSTAQLWGIAHSHLLHGLWCCRSGRGARAAILDLVSLSNPASAVKLGPRLSITCCMCYETGQQDQLSHISQACLPSLHG